MRNSNERGIAMITVLLVLMLMSALLVGFSTIVMSDQRYRFIDRDRARAFYAAAGGVEKLTADIGNLFLVTVAPTATQISDLTLPANRPVISGITYAAASAPTPLPAGLLTPYNCSAGGKTRPVVGTAGYTVIFCASPSGNPGPSDAPTTITGTGAYAGMTAIQSPYQIDVTASTTTGGEVHLTRTLQSVAIPVFQFGIFSEADLGFFAAEDFTFGGRIHTNGNLWLAEGSGNTLTTTGRVTAFKDVVRQYLSNGVTIASVGMTGTLSMATSSSAPTGNRNLAATEGSVTGLPGSTAYSNWQTLSLGATPANYNGYLRNVATGAKKLLLPLTANGVGGTNVDLIKRPPFTEVTTSLLYGERLFSKASLRILLSDKASDITSLPGISAGAPVSLDSDWNTTPPAGYTVDLTHPPVALSPGLMVTQITGSSGGGPYTITVNSTAAFRPVLFLNHSGIASPVTCTTKSSATVFSTCAAGVPATSTGATTFVSAAPGVTSLTTAATAANAASITVASTAGFNPDPFWATVGGVDTLVTCTGYTPTTFTGCNANASSGYAMSAAMSNAGTGLLGGFIKIDKQNTNGTWTDVTLEMLNYGIGGLNLGGTICASDPTPNAIIRLQRLRDNGGANGGGCNYNALNNGIKDPTNWWPNALFDARESALRDTAGLTTMTLGGVMYYVALDVNNLAKYFTATAPLNTPGGATTQTDPPGTRGFTVYFSDRRNNRNNSDQETGEYGWEDFVNPGTGTPNGGLDIGEDMNGNTTLDVYGGVPNYNGFHASVPPCATCSSALPTGYGAAATTGYVLNASASPITTINRRAAQVNRPILFRRALKLVNGGAIAPRLTGLTIVSENPVYIQGDYNTPTTFLPTDVHAATAVIADAVTLLSGSWNDNNSFSSPFAGAGRLRSLNSYYRVAVLGGKGINFDKPSDVGGASVFGTDGGPHNFLRMLEGDPGGGSTTTVHYRGSLATLHFSRQAVGTFKCCSGTAQDGIVYSVPIRDFNFDTDFTQPSLLPPNTPMFRDMNAIGFSQELRPGR